MREMAGVTTLWERQAKACDKFANKCLGTERFSGWFPLKGGRPGSRGKEKFKEDFARCNRLRDSPIFYMRRRLNGKEGKRMGERNKEYQVYDTTRRSNTRPSFKPRRRMDAAVDG